MPRGKKLLEFDFLVAVDGALEDEDVEAEAAEDEVADA